MANALQERDFAPEAAIALSFMGSAAVPTLREAIKSDEPAVRREALRSLGKLRERASIDPQIVVPLLLDVAGRRRSTVPQRRRHLSRHRPRQPGEGSRRAHHRAHGHRGGGAAGGGDARWPPTARCAEPALPALKKAASDPDDDVKREAGRTLVTPRRVETEGLPQRRVKFASRSTARSAIQFTVAAGMVKLLARIEKTSVSPSRVLT